MFKLKNIFLFIIFFSYLFATFSIHALEKDRLIAFLKEYNSSEERKKFEWTKLPYAIENEYFDVAEFLIKKGEAISKYKNRQPVGFQLKHPLWAAIEKGQKNLAELIINSMDLLSEDSLLISNAIFFICAGDLRPSFVYSKLNDKESIEIIEALLLAGIDVNFSTEHYDSILILAICFGRLEMVEFLLNHNADVNLVGRYECSPLQSAISPPFALGHANFEPNLEIIKLLISYGADPLITRNGTLSPLELAMMKIEELNFEQSNLYIDIIDLFLEVSIKN